ncbi:MAG: hypothetical protein EOP49_31800 [Sphingobacteriales bacterium]|nr:MAG: hypothetical protein EOP49_31800 [Sphingobacteriales bacterium]
MHTHTLRIASRHVPEAGAVCGSSARTDLCGGWQVTAIPTATHPSAVSLLDSRRSTRVKKACPTRLLGSKDCDDHLQQFAIAIVGCTEGVSRKIVDSIPLNGNKHPSANHAINIQSVNVSHMCNQSI